MFKKKKKERSLNAMEWNAHQPNAIFGEQFYLFETPLVFFGFVWHNLLWWVFPITESTSKKNSNVFGGHLIYMNISS
jgi:hypothetical protein